MFKLNHHDSRKIVEIQARNFLGIHLLNEHYCLVILNFTKKTFSYVDPYNTQSPNQQKYYENFLKFIEKHNATYPTNLIPPTEWTVKSYHHPLQDPQNVTDCGVFVLKYIRDLIDQNKIQLNQFDINGFRKYLAHYILQHSLNIQNLCIICGYKDDQETEENVDWTRCDICKRWCHDRCTVSRNKTEIFLCVLCKAK